MQCPQCESTHLRKNGHLRGKQRYRCKNCGRQFVDAAPIETVSASQNEPLEVPVIETISSELVTPVQSDPGIAILLLDAENLKFDIDTEKFLVSLCSYSLHVKIAFANWRNPAIGKQDTELFERGYQLIHVPGGKNSADAQMIAMGAAIVHHYPNAKEVLVCSSDWLLTHLCNELQSQGLNVYRVQRQNSNLAVENRNTGKINYYSLSLNTEIPSMEGFVDKIEDLIKAEQESLAERLDKLSILTTLLQERAYLTSKENGTTPSPMDEPQPDVFMQAIAEKSPGYPNGKENSKSNNSSAKQLIAEPLIQSKEELEKALLKLLQDMQSESPDKTVGLVELGVQFNHLYKKSVNSIIKELKIGSNFTKFLAACPLFKLTKVGQKYQIDIAK